MGLVEGLALEASVAGLVAGLVAAGVEGAEALDSDIVGGTGVAEAASISKIAYFASLVVVADVALVPAILAELLILTGVHSVSTKNA